MTYSPRQAHFSRKAHLIARLGELEADGLLLDDSAPWSSADDDVLLTTPESVHALAVLVRRTPAAVRDRRRELYYIDSVAGLRALPTTVPVLDSYDEVHTSDDVDSIVLPAAVVMGRPSSTVDELKAAARAILDEHADREEGNL